MIKKIGVFGIPKESKKINKWKRREA